MLYPMTDEVVLRVDVAGGIVVLAPPEEVDAGDEGVEDAEGDA